MYTNILLQIVKARELRALLFFSLPAWLGLRKVVILMQRMVFRNMVNYWTIIGLREELIAQCKDLRNFVRQKDKEIKKVAKTLTCYKIRMINSKKT